MGVDFSVIGFGVLKQTKKIPYKQSTTSFIIQNS